MATLYRDREFLNDPGHGGSAHYRIEMHSKWYDKESGKEAPKVLLPENGSINIADCHEMISLSINVENKGRFTRSRNKVVRLRDALSRYIDYLDSIESIIPEDGDFPDTSIDY